MPEYFVSYTFATKSYIFPNNGGFGRCDVHLEKEISKITDIEKIEAMLLEKHSYIESVTILYWRQYD